jgi:hypothetical protein
MAGYSAGPGYASGPPDQGYAPPGGPYGYGYGYGYPAGPTTSGRAVAVLVLGIVSIPTAFIFIGFVPAIIALSLAPGARREINESGGRVSGQGMVTAGTITSIIAIVIVVLLIVAGIVSEAFVV